VKLTESEAWRTIGEAFEARAAHPELDDLIKYSETDLARSGLCIATGTLFQYGHITDGMERAMDRKSFKAVNDSGGSIHIIPAPGQPGGSELRATLAYLFAEATA
jgi:hypothetical protein